MTVARQPYGFGVRARRQLFGFLYRVLLFFVMLWTARSRAWIIKTKLTEIFLCRHIRIGRAFCNKAFDLLIG